MADIFISYARADRVRAGQLAQALEGTGWSVWWDREIPPGRSFDEVIEEALSLARCVIVLWSEASVRSEWVKTEASDAAQRRILVPILADGARIPLEFRRIQAAAIDDWRTPESSVGWGQLCDAVAALIDTGRRAPPATAPVHVRRVDYWWAGAGGAVLILLVAAVFLLTRWAHVVEPKRAAPRSAVETDRPLTATPAPSAATVTPIATAIAIRPRPSAAVAATRPATTAAVLATAPASREPAADARSELHPPLIETTAVTRDFARKLDREPRVEAASFDVTVLYGVFRDQAGRLNVSADGVRFHETGGSGRAFELSCGALRRVATATMIADQEQRLLELASDGQSYRVRAADTGTRDSLRAAITRSCSR